MKTESKYQRKALTRQRAIAVLSRMRTRGESLSKAAHAARTTPRTVLKLVGKQVRRSASGQYAATDSDRLKREITIFGSDGYVPVTVRSSKQAQRASEHLIAVNRFLRTGDTEWLKPFTRKRIAGVVLLTDPDRIREFADADEIKLDGLYRNQQGAGQPE